MIIASILAIAGLAVYCYIDYSESKEKSEWIRERVRANNALTDGSVRPGMSFNEIVEIAGYPESTDETNGRITDAWYSVPGSSSYIHLTFKWSYGEPILVSIHK